MKQLLYTIALLLIGQQAVWAQAQKNIVRSHQYNGEQLISLASEGTLEIEEWDEKIVRLVTTIEAVNFNENTLKALAEAGRYTSSSKDVDGTLILTLLKAQRQLEIRGVKIKERYHFKLYVPKGVTVEQVKYTDVETLF